MGHKKRTNYAVLKGRRGHKKRPPETGGLDAFASNSYF